MNDIPTAIKAPLTTQGWGPAARRGAISLSFDNMGEAAALGRGDVVPQDELGRHETVTVMFPRLLRMVGALPATYFIEGSNALMYPQQIRAWQAAGKEVALHAWQHEPWGQLDAPTRQSLLQRSVQAMQQAGVTPRGFRPPGGGMPQGALAQMKEAGLLYCSPLGVAGDSRVEDGMAILPFAWPHVDAYMIDTQLNALRERTGAGGPAKTMDEWQAVLDAALATARAAKCHVTVIFHPVTLLEFPQSQPVLQRFIHQLEAADDLWVASCGDVAAWLTSHTTHTPERRPPA
jgi:peptidoglycan/xylan/chitin deacetylase (PgdA/CDA1 family)